MLQSQLILTELQRNVALAPWSNSVHWSGHWNREISREIKPETVGNPALPSHTQLAGHGELHVSRPSCQYVPEQPGDPLLFRVRLQPHHGAPPYSLGSSLLFWTKLPPNARFLDMDIKRILSEGEKGRGMPGEGKKKGRKKKSLLHNHHLP